MSERKGHRTALQGHSLPTANARKSRSQIERIKAPATETKRLHQRTYNGAREAVRLLAIEFGVREAARRTGLNESTVRSWSKRYKWLQAKPHVNSPKRDVATTATKRPGDILLEELQKLSGQTKLGFARALVKGSKHFEESTPTRIVDADRYGRARV